MSENVFKRYSKHLYDDLFSAHEHYDIYLSIRKNTTRFGKELNCSPRFWSVTLNAHLTATRINLSRVYDQQKDSLNLRKWVQYFRDHVCIPEYFNASTFDSHRTQPLTSEEIENDINQVSSRNELVNKLVRSRGHHIAHTSAKYIADDSSLWEAFPLHNRDYEELLERAARIFNRYIVFVENSSYSFQTHQTNDHDLIFRAIQEFVKN